MPKDRSTPRKPVRASVRSVLAKPFRALWTQDETFHARLVSVLTILAVVIAIAALVVSIVIGMQSRAASSPVVADSAAPQPSLTEQAAPECDAEASDIFLVCLTARRLDREFVRSIQVSPASVFEVQLYFQNTSDEQQKEVVVRFELPEEVVYVEGTTWLHNANGAREVSDGITRGGMIIGGYLPAGNAYLKLALRSGATSAFECGQSIAVIKLVTTTDLGQRTTEFPVTVRRVC